jgi:DNA-binding transcriptional LysR family regulator
MSTASGVATRGGSTSGHFQSISVTVLPTVVHELRRDHPGLVVRPFESDYEEELVDKLLDGELELTFMVGPLPDQLEGRVLYRDPFVVVAPLDAVDDGTDVRAPARQ